MSGSRGGSQRHRDSERYGGRDSSERDTEGETETESKRETRGERGNASQKGAGRADERDEARPAGRGRPGVQQRQPHCSLSPSGPADSCKAQAQATGPSLATPDTQAGCPEDPERPWSPRSGVQDLPVSPSIPPPTWPPCTTLNPTGPAPCVPQWCPSQNLCPWTVPHALDRG